MQFSKNVAKDFWRYKDLKQKDWNIVRNIHLHSSRSTFRIVQFPRVLHFVSSVLLSPLKKQKKKHIKPGFTSGVSGSGEFFFIPKNSLSERRGNA